ncbi:MAG: iron-containing alcohol dehydrogenase, partial [Lachnospiraceae bacterium]
PYVLKYNQRDPIVKEKLDRLSAYCRCDDLTDTISEMNKQMQIPTTFSEAGITKENYDKKYEMILNHAMLGATKVNPVKMTQEEMKKMLKAVYSGEITY